MAVLLVPPWISRAVTVIGVRASDTEETEDEEYGTSYIIRNVVEVCVMAVLQDICVASFAIDLVLLPGSRLVRLMRGYLDETARNTRNSGKHYKPPRDRTNLAGCLTSWASFLVSSIIYLAFVLPIWLDMASHVLSGMRIRANYLVLTFSNLKMFSSSIKSLSSSSVSLWDVRVLLSGWAMFWLFKRLWCAVHGLLDSLSPGVGASKGKPAKRNILCCVSPGPLLFSLASLYMTFVLSGSASMAVSRESTANALKYSNAIYLIAGEMIGMSFLQPSDGFLQPSVSSQSYFSFGRRTAGPDFIFSSERYKDLDATGKYPFFRRTMGFTGPKAFNLSALPNATKPNFVFISMETWRHYDVGVLGGLERRRQRNRTATFNFDRLARSGILFDNFYANGIQTTRTLMSTLFGVMPQFSQAAAMEAPSAHSLNISGIPSLLKTIGYNRTLFASATDMNYQNWDKFLPAHGFDELLDLDWFENRWHQLNLTSAVANDTRLEGHVKHTDANWEPETADDAFAYDDDYAMYKYTDHMSSSEESDPTQPKRNSWGLADEESFRVLADEISRLASAPSPFFLDFYSISSHHPFEVPPSFKAPAWVVEEAGENEEYRKFLEALAYTDQALGDFFNEMRERNVMSNTIFVVAGDHGFGFCEHKPCFEGANFGNAQSNLFDVATRVPMVIVSDLIKQLSRGTVIREAASQVDLLPTVLDMVGLPNNGLPQNSIGRSLMRKLEDESEIAPLMNTFNDQAIGLKRGDLKYVFEGSRLASVYNITKYNESAPPIYHHKLQRRDDPLVGAPKDLMKVKNQVANILADTNNCYKANAFMPPEAAREIGLDSD